MTGTHVTSEDWRGAMGNFPSGVTIATAWHEGAPYGSTVSSFCSVSLEPPLLLICLDKNNPMHGPALKEGAFGVNILSADKGEMAMRFAMPPVETRYEGVAYERHDGGAPHLKDALVFIECVTDQAHEAGTHHVIIGRGERVIFGREQEPLVYHKGGFFDLKPR